MQPYQFLGINENHGYLRAEALSLVDNHKASFNYMLFREVKVGVYFIFGSHLDIIIITEEQIPEILEEDRRQTELLKQKFLKHE